MSMGEFYAMSQDFNIFDEPGGWGNNDCPNRTYRKKKRNYRTLMEQLQEVRQGRWINVNNETVLIEDMSDKYIDNVINFLLEKQSFDKFSVNEMVAIFNTEKTTRRFDGCTHVEVGGKEFEIEDYVEVIEYIEIINPEIADALIAETRRLYKE